MLQQDLTSIFFYGSRNEFNASAGSRPPLYPEYFLVSFVNGGCTNCCKVFVVCLEKNAQFNEGANTFHVYWGGGALIAFNLSWPGLITSRVKTKPR